uniref:FLYWCH-type domain-containing protein n=1 Tax=Meloidogyne hapla TaxID=6305 RepID=A0A1I8B742_MELHA
MDTSDEGEIVSDTTDSEIEEGELAPDDQPQMGNEYILEFFETFSEKGKSLLTRGGFEYNFEGNSKTMEGIEYWKCIKKSHGHCPGRIHVRAAWHHLNELRFKYGKIVNENHTHAASPDNPTLWNLTDRLENGLSRTNNSLEAWHRVWSSLLHRRPRLSQFVKRMVKEFSRWQEIVTEFHNLPANGIRSDYDFLN